MEPDTNLTPPDPLVITGQCLGEYWKGEYEKLKLAICKYLSSCDGEFVGKGELELAAAIGYQDWRDRLTEDKE